MNDVTPEFIAGLRALDAEVGSTSNKHDRAVVLIHACIAGGHNDGSTIVKTLTSLNFDPKHVGLTLSAGCGPSADRHHWEKLTDGSYRSHGVS
ncbi:hypothetical protein [Croceicoccus sp. Ery15]|uniref:hypothetical protein n=1 Tax=Croceicoccus sp. Ery15 TaxID=1703338 RepID=UPI001E336B20|nr:hypothetical protein [Croceicoccus sp. Ery15]